MSDVKQEENTEEASFNDIMEGELWWGQSAVLISFHFRISLCDSFHTSLSELFQTGKRPRILLKLTNQFRCKSTLNGQQYNSRIYFDFK